MRCSTCPQATASVYCPTSCSTGDSIPKKFNRRFFMRLKVDYSTYESFNTFYFEKQYPIDGSYNINAKLAQNPIISALTIPITVVSCRFNFKNTFKKIIIIIIIKLIKTLF